MVIDQLVLVFMKEKLNAELPSTFEILEVDKFLKKEILCRCFRLGKFTPRPGFEPGSKLRRLLGCPLPYRGKLLPYLFSFPPI